MEDTGEDILRQRPSVVTTFFKRIGQTYQIWLDKWTPHTVSRWIFTTALIVAFLLRIVFKQVCNSFLWFILVVSKIIGWFHSTRFFSMDRLCNPYIAVHWKNRLVAGMVHRYICIGNLSPEFTASILNTKDRSGYGGIWSGRRSSWRWRHGIANETKRWVPSIRKKAAWIQVLVLSNKSHSHRFCVYVLRFLQHSCVLAYPCHVFHYIILHYNEATDKAYDTI